MTREMSDARLQGVLRLSPQRRHAWFLQRAREAGEVWGLYLEGWALALDEEGRDVLPLWPTQETARLCATRMWAGYEPQRIPLPELLEELLPELAREAIAVGVFFTPGGVGWPAEAEQLRVQLMGAASA